MALVAGMRQLSYLTLHYSQRQISAITGIPRITLQRAAWGERSLPQMYRSELRNMFQRSSYQELRNFGMNTDQARRFQWRSPETVMTYEGRMIQLTDQLAAGAMRSRLTGVLRKLGYDATALKSWKLEEMRIVAQEEAGIDDLDLWEQSKEAVKEGLRHSSKQFEDWESYGA